MLFYSSELRADTIYLKNGNKIFGIIKKESKGSVEIEINIGAVVAFSREDIDRIEKDSDVKHAELKEDWELEKSKRDVEQTAKDAFEREQREKGLVKHDGRWITPAEKERMQASTIARDIHEYKGGSFSAEQYKMKKSPFADKLLEKGDWSMRETENFYIFYTDSSQAKIVSDKAEYYFEKICYDLGYENEIKWDKKCNVYIVEGVEAWREFLKKIGFNPDLVGGFVPNYGEKEMFLCAISEGYLAVTFPHELTHLIFRDIAGTSTIPLWLNEGLANYEASVTNISGERLVEYIKQGRHILLGDLLRISGYPEGQELRELFYAQSEKLVEFLITQYGRKKFRRFCELILTDKSFKDSLFTAYRKDFENLEDFNIKLVEYIVK